MGLGLSPFLASKIARNPRSVTAQGAVLASAQNIGNQTQIAYVVTTNSGSGLKLPNVGGDLGCLLGDDILVVNGLQASVIVYVSNSAKFIGVGLSASGDTGIGVATCNSAIFYPLTATTWAVVQGGSAIAP